MDLDYPEDYLGDTDMTVVNDGGISEIQGAAEAEPVGEADFATMLGLAKKGISQMHELQQQALSEK